MHIDNAIFLALSVSKTASQLEQLMNVYAKEIQQSIQPNQLSIEISGCFFSLILLRAFACEVALKVLHFQENGSRTENTHQLDRIFDKLEQTTQAKLEKSFQGKLTPNSQNVTLHEVFSEHSRDFEEWRYYYENPSNMNISFAPFKQAVEAVVDECLERRQT